MLCNLSLPVPLDITREIRGSLENIMSGIAI